MKLERVLKEKREQANITQTELAKKLGLSSPQFVSNCERERCAYPVSHFKVLSKTLNIDIATMREMRINDLIENLDDQLRGGKKCKKKRSFFSS